MWAHLLVMSLDHHAPAHLHTLSLTNRISPHSDAFMQAMCRSTAKDLKFIFSAFVSCIQQ